MLEIRILSRPLQKSNFMWTLHPRKGGVPLRAPDVIKSYKEPIYVMDFIRPMKKKIMKKSLTLMLPSTPYYMIFSTEWKKIQEMPRGLQLRDTIQKFYKFAWKHVWIGIIDFCRGQNMKVIKEQIDIVPF